jgi:hypothetical protein
MAERTIPPRPTALDDEFDRLTVDTSTLVANLSGYVDRVGIGTATPAHTLVVTSNSGEEGLQVNGARNQYAASIRSSTVTGEAYGPYFRGGSNSSDIAFAVDNSDGTSNYFKIRGDGNVGIAASDPDQALEVGGVIHVSGEVASPSAPSGGDGGNIYVKSDGRLYYISDTVSETDLSSGGGGSGTVTSITPAADSGSGSAITTSGSITVAGTTNEIETTVSGTTVTVGLPNNVTISGTVSAGDSISASKVVNGDFTGLTLTNNDATAGTGGMVGIQFNLNDTDDDKNLPAGKIQIVKEQSWTNDNATHDAQMRFELAEDGTQAEAMTLTSSGNLSIDGNLQLGGNNLADAASNAIAASDGSGNVTLAAAAKTVTVAGPLISSQGIRQAFTEKTPSGSPHTLDSTNTWINANCLTGGSAGDVTINLPRSSTVGSGFLLYIQDFNGNVTGAGLGNSVTVNCHPNDNLSAGGFAIGGADTREITATGGYLWIISNGTNVWGIIDDQL